VARPVDRSRFSHLHLHLVPRLPDHPVDVRGPLVFSLLLSFLSDDQGRWLPASERDEIALSIREALA